MPTLISGVFIIKQRMHADRQMCVLLRGSVHSAAVEGRGVTSRERPGGRGDGGSGEEGEDEGMERAGG